MGRRGRRAKNKPKQSNSGTPQRSPSQDACISSTSASLNLYKDAVQTPPYDDLPDFYQIQEYKAEMGRTLLQICKEYLKDFSQLKNKKLLETTSFDYIPGYRLSMDQEYRQELEYKIAYVYRYDSSNEVYHIFCLHIQNFVECLKEEILKIDRRNSLIFVASVFDSFQSLKNVATEIARLTSSMFSFENSCASLPFNFTCEPMTKLIFRDKIYRHDDILREIERFKSQQTSRHELLVNVNQMEHELLHLDIIENMDIHLGDYDLPDSWESLKAEDIKTITKSASSAKLNDMDLDSLVSFINGTPTTNGENTSSGTNGKTKKRRKRRRTGSQITNRKSLNDLEPPSTDPAEDRDIDEFRRKLEMTPPPQKHRIKPNVTQDWLKSLRKKMKEPKDDILRV